MGRRGRAGTPVVYRRKSGLGRLLVVLVLLAAVGTVGVSVYVGWNLTHPAPRPLDSDPSAVGLAYETVTFAAADGVTLRGWFLPAQDSPRTIIVAHGYTSNRLMSSFPALELARSFVESGFNVLLFDMRGHGESDGDVTTLGFHEVKDISGAVDWLKSQRPGRAERIGLLGGSMGASTSILAAANDPRIEAVVADSPFSDLRDYLTANMPVWTGLPNVPFTWLIITLIPPVIGVDIDAVSPIRVVSQLPQPLFLIHADGDDTIPSDETRKLAAAARPDRTQVWIVPGTTRHVGGRRADPAVYDERVIGFFKEALGVVDEADEAASGAQESGAQGVEAEESGAEGAGADASGPADEIPADRSDPADQSAADESSLEGTDAQERGPEGNAA